MNKRQKKTRGTILHQMLNLPPNQPITGKMIEALGGFKLPGMPTAPIRSPEEAAKMGIAIMERMGKTDGCNVLIDDGQRYWEVRITPEDALEPRRKSKPTVQ